jgi:hypothetical protein
MKTLLLSFSLAFITLIACAQDDKVRAYEVNGSVKQIPVDSVTVQVDGNNAYYQKVVKLDSSITESLIYVRALQFMASKNFQQNYGYEEEGKLIFTTTQDLNLNTVSTTEDNESVDPYTVQFAISLDMKNRRYRYTIHNVIFYLPTDNGNRRITLYEMYLKANNIESKRVRKDAYKLILSFERYINTLTAELYENVVQKSKIHDPKF